MKIVKVLLIILGVLLLVGGAAVAITNFTAGEPFICSRVASAEKESQQAIKEYQAAMGTPREKELMKKSDEGITVYRMALSNCDNAKSHENFVLITFLIIAGIGFLLTIVGFFIGRKKAIA